MAIFFDGKWGAGHKRYVKSEISTTGLAVAEQMISMGLKLPIGSTVIINDTNRRRVMEWGSSDKDMTVTVNLNRDDVRHRKLGKSVLAETLAHEFTHLIRHSYYPEDEETVLLGDRLAHEGIAYYVGKVVSGRLIGKEHKKFWQITSDPESLRVRAGELITHTNLGADGTYDHFFANKGTLDRTTGHPLVAMWAVAEVREHIARGAGIDEIITWESERVLNLG